ncbi:MAG: zinc/iron permease [Bryobacterales bacterium]|nr:zinc/iron permease [Bryobacterales bacterium]
MNLRLPDGTLILPAAAFAVAVAGAVPGLYLNSIPRAARVAIPFSGGILLGVSLFGLLPELAGEIGWLRGLPVFAAGYLLLLLLDRYVFAVCPSCSHDHNHSDCSSALHGFTVPLVFAASAHAFLDGWGLVGAEHGVSAGVRIAFPVAVMLHKIPEGLALGAILRASTRSRGTAFAWCVAVEAATLVGGAAGIRLTPHLGSAWTNYPLAVAGGCFLYLGYHAIHGKWRPAVTGIAGAAVLQQGARVLFG